MRQELKEILEKTKKVAINHSDKTSEKFLSSDILYHNENIRGIEFDLLLNPLSRYMILENGIHYKPCNSKKWELLNRERTLEVVSCLENHPEILEALKW